MRKLISIFLLTFSIVGLSYASLVSPVFDNGNDHDKDGNKMTTTSNTQSVFSVIPSPQNEKLSIQFDLNANVSSVKLIDNQSSVVYEGTRSRGASNVMDIPIEDMEPGTYFIRVKTDKGVAVERVIIQK